MSAVCVHCRDHGILRCDATGCDRAPVGPFDPAIHCRPCWLKFNKIGVVAPVIRKPLPCVSLGEPTGSSRPCASCGGATVSQPVHVCAIHEFCTPQGVTTDANGRPIAACRICKDYVADEPLPVLPKVSSSSGVVIGSYGFPECVRLNILTIRDTCGPVPILVSDDCTPGTQLRDICTSIPDVTLIPNPARIGHTGGDISALWKGIQWAAGRGLRTLCKLSQRAIPTAPNWLHDGARDLIASGLPLATRACRGIQMFDLRTEAMLLDVLHWNKPEILARLVPRKYYTDVPHGICAETIVNRVFQDFLGDIYWPWGLYGEERYEKAPGFLWHNSHDAADYHALAAKHGVSLGADFHTQGWESAQNAGTYLYG